MTFSMDRQTALDLDHKDPLRGHRDEFLVPKIESGEPVKYFAGHSLGLMPKLAKEYINNELKDWENYGVEGHFKGKLPWLPYHEFVTNGFSQLVGAKESEVVAMGSLTSNLHLAMVSFYRPTKERNKILIENNTFPSDKYAVDSQARFHGYDPKEAIIELQPEGTLTVSPEAVLNTIETHKDELALIMLGNVNYLSGQKFEFQQIVDLAHKYEIPVGFNLAHGAGNLELKLHDWNVDFAVWCSYKYLNSGPGGIAGMFIHENHHGRKDIPRFEGWWGHDKASRFEMGPQFSPIPTVEAWQLSNPPIFQLAALRASLDLFLKAGLSNIFEKRNQITSYLEALLRERCGTACTIHTPADIESRGSMLCIEIKEHAKEINQRLEERGAVCDFRYPNILRIAPVPQYTRYIDVYDFVSDLKDTMDEY